MSISTELSTSAWRTPSTRPKDRPSPAGLLLRETPRQFLLLPLQLRHVLRFALFHHPVWQSPC